MMFGVISTWTASKCSSSWILRWWWWNISGFTMFTMGFIPVFCNAKCLGVSIVSPQGPSCPKDIPPLWAGPGRDRRNEPVSRGWKFRKSWTDYKWNIKFLRLSRRFQMMIFLVKSPQKDQQHVGWKSNFQSFLLNKILEIAVPRHMAGLSGEDRGAVAHVHAAGEPRVLPASKGVEKGRKTCEMFLNFSWLVFLMSTSDDFDDVCIVCFHKSHDVSWNSEHLLESSSAPQRIAPCTATKWRCWRRARRRISTARQLSSWWLTVGTMSAQHLAQVKIAGKNDEKWPEISLFTGIQGWLGRLFNLPMKLRRCSPDPFWGPVTSMQPAASSNSIPVCCDKNRS